MKKVLAAELDNKRLSERVDLDTVQVYDEKPVKKGVCLDHESKPLSECCQKVAQGPCET